MIAEEDGGKKERGEELREEAEALSSFSEGPSSSPGNLRNVAILCSIEPHDIWQAKDLVFRLRGRPGRPHWPPYLYPIEFCDICEPLDEEFRLRHSSHILIGRNFECTWLGIFPVYLYSP